MKPALLIICLFISLTIFGQSLQELNQQVVTLYRNGEYKKAIPYAEQSVKLTGQTLGENNAQYVKTLNILALIYIQAGEYEKAISAAIRSTELWKNLEGESGRDYIASMSILADLYRRTGVSKGTTG